MALVYMATNLANGHQYVGYTSHSFQSRKRQHIYTSRADKPNMAIARAIKKYGEDSFKFEIVQDGLSIDEAWHLEKSLIEKLKPYYNVSIGGKSGASGIQWAAKSRALLSSKLRGKKFSAEARARMKIAQNSWDRSRLYRPVICLNDGIYYPSLRHAAAAYSVRKGDVVAVCNGRQLSTKGKSFAYYHDGFSEKYRLELLGAIRHRKKPAKKGKPVVCLDDGIVYQSVLEAAKALERTGEALTYAIRHNRPCHGKRFAYYADKAA